MIAALYRPSETVMNSVVYLDFENISILLHQVYGQDLIKLDFYNVIKRKLRESGFTIVDFIVYSNFVRPKDQTYLRSIGLQTRQSSIHGKNCSDLELTVDALRTLYTNQTINTFVIISSDRDIIPLLKAIKYENKFTYVLSTKNGFNQIVTEYADFHLYIEDLFCLKPVQINDSDLQKDLNIDLGSISGDEIERAKEVSRYFYQSSIFQKSNHEHPVGLHGYINVLKKSLNRFPEVILHDFWVAHKEKYIRVYQDCNKRLMVEEGEKKEECFI